MTSRQWQPVTPVTPIDANHSHAPSRVHDHRAVIAYSCPPASFVALRPYDHHRHARSHTHAHARTSPHSAMSKTLNFKLVLLGEEREDEQWTSGRHGTVASGCGPVVVVTRAHCCHCTSRCCCTGVAFVQAMLLWESRAVWSDSSRTSSSSSSSRPSGQHTRTAHAPSSTDDHQARLSVHSRPDRGSGTHQHRTAISVSMDACACVCA